MAVDLPDGWESLSTTWKSRAEVKPDDVSNMTAAQKAVWKRHVLADVREAAKNLDPNAEADVQAHAKVHARYGWFLQ